VGGYSFGHETAECATALDEVLIFDRVFCWAVVRRNIAFEHCVSDFIVEMQAVAQNAQLLDVHLLDLVCGVAAFDFRSERPTLDGLAENCRRAARTEIVACSFECGIHLAIVMTTARQRLQLGISEVRHHLAQPWVRAEEIFSNVVAIFDGVALKLTVNRGVHLVEQRS